MILFCSCKKQNNISEVKQNNTFDKKLEIRVSNKKIDDCKVLLQKLVSTSTLQNPFIKNLDVEIDKIDEKKMTIKLFDNLDKEQNAIGWIVIDVTNKKIFDITNDIENPIVLEYDDSLWNKMIDCYFNSNKLFKKDITENLKKVNCQNTQLDDGQMQVCVYLDTSLEKVYKTTIEKSEINDSENLPINLPLKNETKNIDKNSLISISDSIFSKNKIQFEFLYEGGVTTLMLEQNGKNVKRTIIYSAD